MLARDKGRVVLVVGAIPGERVRARVNRKERDVIHATVTEVLEPDPDRREVDVDAGCGGQVYRHIAYSRQLTVKSQVVSDTLNRVGKLRGIGDVAVAPSPERGYRMRARFHLGPQGLGFLREGTHTVCDAAQTGQLLSETSQVVAAVGRRLIETGEKAIGYVELAENMAADQRVVHFEQGCDLRSPLAVDWFIGSGCTGVTHVTDGTSNVKTLFGTPTVTDPVSVLTGEIEPKNVGLTRHAPSFFQANRYLLPKLVRAVCRRVTVSPVLDLYSGVGLFAVSLASRGFDGITAVEGNRLTLADLRRNTSSVRPRIEVVHASVRDYLKRCSGPLRGTVVVDPPRTGLSQSVIERLLELRVSPLVYVACDVATFARDLRRFNEAGYKFENLEAFDMFPNTPHVELLVTLRL